MVHRTDAEYRCERRGKENKESYFDSIFCVLFHNTEYVRVSTVYSVLFEFLFIRRMSVFEYLVY